MEVPPGSLAEPTTLAFERARVQPYRLRHDMLEEQHAIEWERHKIK